MPNSHDLSEAGVILMTYGSATTAERVADYMQHIYRGKASDTIIKDFQQRYKLVGRSPLVDVTEQQAALLSDRLGGAQARAAMLHSPPFIGSVVGELREQGAKQLVGIILSPQFSSFIMDGYHSALKKAAAEHGYTEEDIVVANPWPTESHFIKLLANRVKDSLQKLRDQYYVNIPVLFTTHSLPKRVVDKDPAYLDQLKATIDAVIHELNDKDLEWYTAYQSAGHTPEAWLKPDIVDILAKLRATANPPAILIVPIQFLADHLEILYDLDIAGREQCAEYNIAYNRIELPNTDPLFIDALEAIARRNKSVA